MQKNGSGQIVHGHVCYIRRLFLSYTYQSSPWIQDWLSYSLSVSLGSAWVMVSHLSRFVTDFLKPTVTSAHFFSGAMYFPNPWWSQSECSENMSPQDCEFHCYKEEEFASNCEPNGNIGCTRGIY